MNATHDATGIVEVWPSLYDIRLALGFTKLFYIALFSGPGLDAICNKLGGSVLTHEPMDNLHVALGRESGLIEETRG